MSESSNLVVLESHRFENSLMVVVVSSLNMTGEQLIEKLNNPEETEDYQKFMRTFDSLSFHFLNPDSEELKDNFLKLPFKKIQKFFVPGSRPMVGMLVIDSEDCYWLTPDTNSQPAVKVSEQAVEQFKYDIFQYYSQMLAVKEAEEVAPE